ncbi:MAG: NERD domain-containing protein [Candidatus Nitrosocosmicus sp.]|nr:NERD domain-containing protein [Candidatus Nitrosocosmicus sp.]
MKINPNSLLSLLKEFNSNINKIKIKNNVLTIGFLDFLSIKGVLIRDKQIDASSYNKIIIALAAVEHGVDILTVCKLIDWKDFELFASEVMKFHNYAVYKNYRIKNPTRQIDVIGVSLQNALVIDCKHWRRNSYSEMVAVVDKQKERCTLFVKKNKSFEIENAYPIIITFYPYEFQCVNQVPIVQ